MQKNQTSYLLTRKIRHFQGTSEAESERTKQKFVELFDQRCAADFFEKSFHALLTVFRRENRK